MPALCLRTGGLLTRGLLIRTTGVLGGEGGNLGGERGWLLSLFENISRFKILEFSSRGCSFPGPPRAISQHRQGQRSFCCDIDDEPFIVWVGWCPMNTPPAIFFI